MKRFRITRIITTEIRTLGERDRSTRQLSAVDVEFPQHEFPLALPFHNMVVNAANLQEVDDLMGFEFELRASLAVAGVT